jgi:hypothetical protein
MTLSMSTINIVLLVIYKQHLNGLQLVLINFMLSRRMHGQTKKQYSKSVQDKTFKIGFPLAVLRSTKVDGFSHSKRVCKACSMAKSFDKSKLTHGSRCRCRQFLWAPSLKNGHLINTVDSVTRNQNTSCNKQTCTRPLIRPLMYFWPRILWDTLNPAYIIVQEQIEFYNHWHKALSQFRKFGFRWLDKKFENTLYYSWEETELWEERQKWPRDTVPFLLQESVWSIGSAPLLLTHLQRND